MPNQKLIKYIPYKNNPSLALYQAVEELEAKQEAFFRQLKAEMTALVAKEIANKAQTEITNIGLIKQMTEKAVNKFSADWFVDTKGDKGDKGENGYTPKKGIDYFDGENGYTPIKGKDYFDGEKGEKGERGKDGKDGRDGKQGLPGLNGLNGKDGSPDKPKDIVKKLQLLKGNERLDASAIKNLPTNKDAKMGYMSGGGLDWRKVKKHQALIGDVNGVNTTFTLPSTPISGDTVEIFVNGQQQKPITNYTVASKTITFTSAPLVGMDMWVNYIEQ